MIHPVPRVAAGRRTLAGLAVVLGACAGAAGAATDLANVPLFTSSNSDVKPNLMFVLDDSGSMGWNYLPDAANSAVTTKTRASAQCNGVAYNPKVIYPRPVDHEGTEAAVGTVPGSMFSSGTARTVSSATSLSIASTGDLTLTFTSGSPQSNWFSSGDVVVVYSDADQSRWVVGTVTSWGTSGGTGTLTLTLASSNGSGSISDLRVRKGTPSYYHYVGSEESLAYTYTTTGSVVKTTLFYKECNGSSGVGNFLPVVVTSASPDAENYGNWYAYHRTRMQTMRVGISQAFKNLDSRYRVGFTTINTTVSYETTSNVFLDVDNFEVAHKEKFYERLNKASPSGNTPLRGALSRAGQYFANKASGQMSDPMQYACQRNFTLLSTDGYWNETGTPSQLNGAEIGQQDGNPEPAPFNDGVAVSNTLADVAMYYYKTDLRSAALGNDTGAKGIDVAANDKITGTPGDPATHQHMKTFTLGFGIDGLLGFTPDYDKGTSTDFEAIKNGTLNWPKPVNYTISTVDDMWHAAVNGRGKYFSAKDSNSLAKSLNEALVSINAKTGTAAAAATSTLQPVAGNNKVFVGEFRSAEWTGDLHTFTIDPASGEFSSAPIWSAKPKLNAAVAADPTSDVASRNIYYAKGAALRAFTAVNLAADGMAGSFTGFCSKTGAGGATAPAQCAEPGFDQVSANQPANLVAYLRGRALNTLYRERAGVLGDMINASPVFLGKPQFMYAENDYAGFKAANVNRAGTVFVAANDGMLHALDAETGAERWAFIPSLMLPKIYRLADTAYPNHHEYFVDGTPTVADIYVAGEGWKSILVGGFNAGGRGYYALDVTDPVQPKLLWEYSHSNLGYTFGNPIVTKRANGTWVVAFASGYNNVSPGDGIGRMFVLNANTGALDTSISTGAGSTTKPSGLAKLNAWVDSPIDNTAKRFYGGDLLGNLWRIDLDSLVEPNAAALKLANFQVAGELDPQPITTRPVLGLLDANGAKRVVVFVATGQYLGVSDLVTEGKQTIYAIKDDLVNVSHGDVRAGGQLVAQTLTTDGMVRTIATTNPVNWATKAGWMVDLPSTGERTNVDMRMEFNILTVASNLPSDDPCTVGGSSWLYRLDIATGGTVPGATTVGEFMPEAQTVGLTSVQLTTGESMTIVVDSSGKLTAKKASPPPVVGPPRRTSWRELVN